MFGKLFPKSTKIASAANRSTVENLEHRTMMSAAPTAIHGDTHRHEIGTVISLKHRQGKVANHVTDPGMNVQSGAAIGPGLTEPLVNMSGLHEVNYGNYPLYAAGGPSINDVNQGEVGDCYYLSAIAAEAAKDPARIESICRARGDGTFDVYFYNKGWVDEHVDGELPANSSGQLVYAQVGQGNCIWPAIMEKAFCFFRASELRQTPSYNVINGGTFGDDEGLLDMGLGAMNVSGSAFSSAAQLYNYVAEELNGHGYNVLLSTNSRTSPLVDGHCYTVVGAEVYYGTDFIEVRNPWGRSTPGGQPYIWVTASSVFGQVSQLGISTI